VGPLTADTCTGTIYDSTIEIFDGTGGCGALVSLACNDDTCGLQSSVTVPAVTGTTYYIRVGGFAGDTGVFTLTINGPSGTGTVATSTNVGAGCVRKFTSFYEDFPVASSFDLNSSTMTMLPTNPGYQALAFGTFVPPTGAAVTLALGDDSDVTQSLTLPFPYDGGVALSLTVCSNGFVSVGAGNGTSFVPDVNTMLNAPDTGWWCWHDFNPTTPGSGTVKFQEIGPIAYITWDGVWDYGGASAANASTFQMQFDSSSGMVTFAWQTMSPLGGATATGFLVGYSPGGPSANPGSVDISVALGAGAISTFGVDLLPLSLVSLSRPVTSTTWNLSTVNIPATGLIGVEILGMSNPGIPDLGFLGMPTCGLYASLDFLNVFPVLGVSHNWGLAIPASPILVNVHVYATSAVFQVPPVNAFGAIVSNGQDGKIGDL
jgi:hypothetical protein